MLRAFTCIVLILPLSSSAIFSPTDAFAAPKTPPTVVSAPHLPPEIRSALQDRRFDQAIKAIDAHLQEHGVADADYLLYLRARAQIELQLYEPAIATFRRLQTEYPKSAWLSRARFGHAEVFMRQRNYQEAGEIYQKEAQRLLSAGRRDELAAIYLEFADRYFNGFAKPDSPGETEHDYPLAGQFYEQARGLRPSLEKKQQIDLRIARCRQETRDLPAAVAAYRQFLADYCSDAAAAKRAPALLEIEARYRLGSVLLQQVEPAEARRTWQDLLDTSAFKLVDTDFLARAQFDLAQTYGIPSPTTDGDLELGVAALEKFLKAFPKSRLRSTAELDIAISYGSRGRFEQAIARLESMIDNPAYASSAPMPKARYLLGEILLSQQKFDQAIAVWRAFLTAYPNHPAWSEAQSRIIDAELLKAMHQRDEKHYAAARELWQTFLKEHPLDRRAPAILYQLGRMKYLEGLDRVKAQAAGAAGKEKTAAPIDATSRALFEQAIDEWRRLVSKYEHSDVTSSAALWIGIVLEERLGRLADAIEAYRKAGNASGRIARLVEKQMEIVTPRKFRTGEHPFLQLVTRNVGKVTVKVYPVEMTDYFRKMHLASEIEKLDIALIDPDKNFEYAVKDYEKYRRFDNNVPLPVSGPGVWAVTVSSDKLEATTMVVVSDLDIIVKASRNELFVFAEDVTAQKPAAGARLLVSDGSKIFAEETTGQDGVLQKSYDVLKTVGDLRVFAIRDGHMASTVNALQGIDFAVGLAPVGHIDTDRPAYRRGELVNLRGMIRWVAHDQFTFKQGERYKLEVVDPRGRTIHAGEVRLGKFGTFATSFLLPDSVPQGTCSIRVFQPNGNQSYTSQFEVHETRLEPIRLEINLPRKVFYRGEKIEGKIRLAYYYGTPLAGREVQYRLGDDRIFTGTTNAAGELTFELPTRRYSESQTLALAAIDPEHNLRTVEKIFLAAREFDVHIATVRKVYIVGETFDASITATNAAGQPVATKLSLEVFEQLHSGGRHGERLVETQTVNTDKDKGTAHATIHVDKSGRYQLRATAVDRFGTPVSGSHDVLISGNDDQVRLRILADRHNYQTGDTARVKLHWREAPALALVAYEGASILGHRLVELKTGPNELEFPVETKLAPNFVLSVAVIDRTRFHQAASDFSVARKLRISLKPQTAAPKPGEPLTVEISTADPQGKPVSAELSLAMVQRNLLDYFATKTTPLDEVFAGARRQPSMRTSASCVFDDRPTTRGENLDVQEEVSKERAAEAEAAQRRAMPGAREEEDDQYQYESSENSLDLEIEGRPSVTGNGSPRTLEFGQEEGTSYFAIHVIPNEPQQQPNQESKKPKKSLARNYVGEASKDKSPANSPPPGGLGTFGAPVYESKRHERESGVEFDEGFVGMPERKRGESSSRFRQNSDLELAYQAGQGALPETPGARTAEGRLFPEALVGETGYWNPAVVTGSDGKASVTFLMPPRSTAWKLLTSGIDAQALAGNAEAEVTARKDFFGEMKLPQAFTAGDHADVQVDVHNSSIEKGARIDVRFKVSLGERTSEVKKSLLSRGPGIETVFFPNSLAEPGTAEIELTVESDAHRDVSHATVPVRPFGLEVFSTASGSAEQSTIALVDSDRKPAPEKPKLEILIGPNVDRALLDAVLGSAPGSLECERALATNPLERATSEVLGGTALLAMIRSSRQVDSPEAGRLADRIRSAIAQLVSAQRDGGGWDWSGGDNAHEFDRFLSARVGWAFAAARRAGFAVPNDAFEKLTAYLASALAQARPAEHDTQAVLFHALAECGKGDFGIGNRLYRERNHLGPSALLYVALGLARMDRKEMAGELLRLVPVNVDPVTANHPASGALVRKDALPVRSTVELRALQLLAIEAIDPASDKTQKLADWLLSARQGSRWNPERANGPAVAALARWFSQVKPSHEKYALAVYVNDQLLEKLTIDPAVDASRRLAVPPKMLVQGRSQRINFDMQGRGRFSYSAVLSGFVPAERLSASTNDWAVERWYEPAQRMLDGQIIPRGFDVLTGSYTTFRNDLTQLAVGAQGEVTLHVWRRDIRPGAEGQLDYLVLSEPIPAGATVLPGSVRGSFERYEISPGVITFYIGDLPYPGTYQYTLIGYSPGAFRAAPSVVSSFYEPQRIAVSSKKSLDVVPRGTPSRDSYRLTPRELFELGTRLVVKGQFAPGAGHLSQLLKQYRLRDDIYRQAVQSLFRAALATNDDSAIVENFEIIKERLPDVEIDFDSILRVAGAYHNLGEYERSFLVYRATIEAAFQRETQIAGFLDQREQFLRSVQVMERLLREYPAEPYVATATYSLAQEICGKATAVAQNHELRRAGLTKADLIEAGIVLLDDFVATWPSDPAADRATFSTATAFLDLEKYDAAIERSRGAVARYPKSELADSFWYVIGYSEFSLGQSDEALATCRKVAEMTRTDPQTGQVEPAQNKWQAIYITGQIFHSLGKPAQAVAEYERVKDKFADAREAMEFFLRRGLTLPEVTLIRPNEKAKLKLSYRNIARADMKVYRIDLLKFGLLQRSLAKIAAINLAGIRPYHQLSLELGDGKDYRDCEKIVSLPLKDEGAYLVVCRGGDDYASGVVLVSALDLAIQEDAVSGRVRVTAKDVLTSRYQSKVQVNVTGSDNNQFVSGRTDLRGIFTADAIHGTATVIARAGDNRYAFFRGATWLGAGPNSQTPDDITRQPNRQQSQQAAPKAGPSDQKELLQNVIRSQNAIQGLDRGNYRNLLRNSKKGVKAKDAY